MKSKQILQLRRVQLLLCVTAGLWPFSTTRPLIAQGYHIGLNFTGTDYLCGFCSGTIPDTMGAVGPSHIVESLNYSFSVFNKATGDLILRVPAENFWQTAFAANQIPTDLTQVFDPRIVYDHSSRRWFATGITYPILTEHLVLAVSNTSDPTQGWKAVSFDAAAFGFEPSFEVNWADFDQLGVDAQGVYVAVTLSSPAENTKAGWVSIPKADLVSALPTTANATVSVFDPATPGNLSHRFTPTVDFGPSKSRSPVLWESYDYNYTQLGHITNSVGPGPAQLTAPTTIPIGSALPNPPGAPQRGNSSLISTGSGGVESNTVTVRNTVWYVRTVAQDGRSAIRWLEIDEANYQLLQSGVIADPQLSLYEPSIAVNEFGDAVIGFSGSSANDYIGSYAAVGRTINNVTTFGNVTLLKAGEATYRAEYPTGLHRWGDYSATVLDPVDHQSFWTFQEFAKDTLDIVTDDYWGIQITQIKLDRLLGDYNFDGTVNAADYVTWRNSIGAIGMGLAADGDGSGTVDIADFSLWKTHYGQAAGSGAGGAAGVPEPASAVLAAVSIILCNVTFRRRR